MLLDRIKNSVWEYFIFIDFWVIWISWQSPKIRLQFFFITEFKIKKKEKLNIHFICKTLQKYKIKVKNINFNPML